MGSHEPWQDEAASIISSRTAGVVFTTYEPAGEVQTGSFATKEPSEAELERREKFAREDA